MDKNEENILQNKIKDLEYCIERITEVLNKNNIKIDLSIDEDELVKFLKKEFTEGQFHELVLVYFSKEILGTDYMQRTFEKRIDLLFKKVPRYRIKKAIEKELQYF